MAEAEAVSPVFDDSESSDDEQDDYEVIDATQASQSLMQKFLTLDLSQQPAYTQAAVGGASGWVTGFAFSRVGKAVAAALGGSLLLVHLGSRAGYITVDWERLDRDVKTAQTNISKKISGKQNPRVTKSFLKKGTKFLTRNMVAVGGFLGGFLLGAAT